MSSNTGEKLPTVRIGLIGVSSVGKTNLALAHTKGTRRKEDIITMAFEDHAMKIMTIQNGVSVEMNIFIGDPVGADVVGRFDGATEGELVGVLVGLAVATLVGAA